VIKLKRKPQENQSSCGKTKKKTTRKQTFLDLVLPEEGCQPSSGKIKSTSFYPKRAAHQSS